MSESSIGRHARQINTLVSANPSRTQWLTPYMKQMLAILVLPVSGVGPCVFTAQDEEIVTRLPMRRDV